MEHALTRRQCVVLAAMAARSGAQFAPVQVQKMFFLIDENLASALGGKQFNFEPYDYGPFDKGVYLELETLQAAGLSVTQRSGSGQRAYALTPEGQRLGEQFLDKLGEPVRDYVGRLSDWIRSLSFAELVGSIYKAYPAMKANSIFNG